MAAIIRKHLRTSGIAIFACIALTMVALAAPGKTRREEPPKLWLSHFVGDQVRVKFAASGNTIEAKLMDVEIPGIVLKRGETEVFFPFANIVSVIPSKQ